MISFLPTPIGHLGDLTLRGLAALREADLVVCEDTRHTRKLLTHYELSPPLLSMHEHNESQRIEEIVAQAEGGKRVVVVSDAGMPGLSDPGHLLIRACVEQGVNFEVLPGPSAVLTALIASGLAPLPFSFGGFLPVKKGKRRRVLEEALGREETALFFESPHRIGSTLELLAELEPGRSAVVARELTKKFETLHRGTVAELAVEFQQAKARGEIVLALAGLPRVEKKRSSSDDLGPLPPGA